ncbi:neurofilament medium polypeptide-like, partial [Seriola lalandi dorsalis]
MIQQEEGEKELPPKQTEAVKKGVELKKTPSPRVGKDKVEEEKALKPIKQLKKVELKKTPSPKAEPKPKEMEQVPIEKKPSAEKVKRIPKMVSPKDSIEAVTLKKVPKKPSPQVVSEPEKPGKGRVPLVKEVSPGAVQMKKVPTQPEEEVFEEEGEEMEGEEDEEAWGWELVPQEDWEDEGVDGALETPGMPGGKRDGKPSEEAPKGRGRGFG